MTAQVQAQAPCRTSLRRPLVQPWRSWGLHAWMILCLLLAQGLGQGHRIAHVGARLAPQAVEQGRDAWGHALGSVDCQLFDHLAQADQAAAGEAAGALLSLDLSSTSRPDLPSVALEALSPSARGPPVPV